MQNIYSDSAKTTSFIHADLRESKQKLREIQRFQKHRSMSAALRRLIALEYERWCPGSEMYLSYSAADTSPASLSGVLEIPSPDFLYVVAIDEESRTTVEVPELVPEEINAVVNRQPNESSTQAVGRTLEQLAREAHAIARALNRAQLPNAVQLVARLLILLVGLHGRFAVARYVRNLAEETVWYQLPSRLVERLYEDSFPIANPTPLYPGHSPDDS